MAGACVAEETPSPSASPTGAADPIADGGDLAHADRDHIGVAHGHPGAVAQPGTTGDRRDSRVVAATVVPDIGDEGGTLTVTVTSAAAERIDELVLRWPTELNRTLILAPFTPSEDRIRDGGPPLVQPWTKWVRGPGEQGEPDGTISVGWGPLLPQARARNHAPGGAARARARGIRPPAAGRQ